MAPVATISFPALRAGLRRAVAADDLDRARDLVDGFHELVMAALGAGDRARLAQLGGQAARLRNIVETAGAEAPALPALVSDLRRVACTIEIAWTQQTMQGARQEPTTPQQFTV